MDGRVPLSGRPAARRRRRNTITASTPTHSIDCCGWFRHSWLAKICQCGHLYRFTTTYLPTYLPSSVSVTSDAQFLVDAIERKSATSASTDLRQHHATPFPIQGQDASASHQQDDAMCIVCETIFRCHHHHHHHHHHRPQYLVAGTCGPEFVNTAS
jgi:hypothetical protein